MVSVIEREDKREWYKRDGLLEGDKTLKNLLLLHIQFNNILPNYRLSGKAWSQIFCSRSESFIIYSVEYYVLERFVYSDQEPNNFHWAAH